MRAYRGSGGIAPPIFKPHQCEWFLSNDNNNNNNNNNTSTINRYNRIAATPCSLGT
jgi:hypothetical protein